jgi:hypothetical protein
VLDIPSWPTDNVQGPSGRLHFRDGVVTFQPRESDPYGPPDGSYIAILHVSYGDVDRDGADETVADIGCIIEGGSEQLVAFDRDSTGHIVTIGRVVATTGEVRDIRDDRTRVVDGVIQARVGDYQGCCDDRTPQKWQNRGYALQHGRFRQVAGPTAMPVNPAVTQTRIRATAVTLGPVVTGYRYGTVAVTMTHEWGVRPAALTVWFRPSPGLERAGSAWPPATAQPDGFTVTLQPPPKYGSRTYRFGLRAPETMTGGRLGVEAVATSRTGEYLSEAVPWDNATAVVVTSVD